MIAESEDKPTEFLTKKLNGVYKNKIGNNNRIGLWNILADNKTFKGDTTLASENSFVKFELISETELKVSLIENNLIIKSMEFNGKIVDNYFSIDKKLLLIPIPALYFLRERKTIIGNNENGDLILTRVYKNAGWLIIMASSYGGINSYEFKKIN